jgi:hypothetical protein
MIVRFDNAASGRSRTLLARLLIEQNSDLTGLFWTKQCEKLSLERSFGYAEEEI